MIAKSSAINQAQSFHDIRIEGRDNSLVINQIIQISVEAVTQQTLIRSSPYLGLQRFEGKHHSFFFGRDEFVARLLRVLPQRGLLAVLGPSVAASRRQYAPA